MISRDEQKCFWAYDIEWWCNKLRSSENGVSIKQANDYLQKFGIHKRKQSNIYRDLKLLSGQFLNPLMLLLIGAIILSAFLGDISEVVIVSMIVLSTGILSYIQERNAGKVVQKLQSLISAKCTVLRGGIYSDIPSASVVPGDIIVFNAGDIIPADCIIVSSNELHINEASLTGESFPVQKFAGKIKEDTPLPKRYNCLWEGTNVVSGKAKALVINTGNDTLFGDIVIRSGTTVESTFEKGIKDFGYFLMKITLFLSIFILIANILNHKSIVDSTLFALALAVGMAPELLPAITTIAMSAGANRLLKKKVIVKKLSSIQNLGEVNLLCSDKTGTITEGTIIVDGTVDFEGNNCEFTKKLAIWNASFETGYSNPIDEALKILNTNPNEKIIKTGEIPFDFLRKRLSIGIDNGTDKIFISKGAFDQILEICTYVRCSNGEIKKITPFTQNIKDRYTQFGFDGYRVIAVGYKNYIDDPIQKSEESEMIFAGYVLLKDPVKVGITETIGQLRKLNVGLKIITGDNKNVAKSIGMQLGIDHPVIMTGKELFNTSSEALRLKVKSIDIFAEVEPHQKEIIIQALRKSFTVAYMGDGINDVSALNAADVGICVDNSADVAKEAADFVLMQKDLSVLVEGIREGRKTFANTLKYIYISTGSTFGNMFSVATASLILPFLPMLPKQILLTNFISDFPYMMIASDNVDEEQLSKPGKWNQKIINRYMIIFGIHSSFFDVLTFVVLLYILKAKESTFQTSWFIESVLTELCILFIIRTHKSFFKSQPSTILFILSMIGLLFTIVLPYLSFAQKLGLVPLSIIQLSSMISIIVAYIITADILKIWFFKKYIGV